MFHKYSSESLNLKRSRDSAGDTGVTVLASESHGGDFTASLMLTRRLGRRRCSRGGTGSSTAGVSPPSTPAGGTLVWLARGPTTRRSPPMLPRRRVTRVGDESTKVREPDRWRCSAGAAARARGAGRCGLSGVAVDASIIVTWGATAAARLSALATPGGHTSGDTIAHAQTHAQEHAPTTRADTQTYTMNSIVQRRCHRVVMVHSATLLTCITRWIGHHCASQCLPNTRQSPPSRCSCHAALRPTATHRLQRARQQRVLEYVTRS
jgi:hypothetical protein